MDEQTMPGTALAKRWVSNSALRLAGFTGISTLVVSFAIVRFYSILSRNGNMSARDFAGPLAAATLVGVLSSRARRCRNIPPAKTIITVAVVPFVAFCTFLAAFVIVFGLYWGHSHAYIGPFTLRVGSQRSSSDRAMVCASFLRAQKAFVSHFSCRLWINRVDPKRRTNALRESRKHLLDLFTGQYWGVWAHGQNWKARHRINQDSGFARRFFGGFSPSPSSL
jgi:hypothetical protein